MASKLTSVVLINTYYPFRCEIKGVIPEIADLLYLYNRRNRIPLDLAFTASVIEETCPNVRVIILDANAEQLQLKSIRTFLQDLKPSLVVATTSSYDRWICPYPSIERPYKLFESLLPIKNNTIFVAIGPHGAVLPEGTLEELPVDAVVTGEPEYTVAEIVKRIEEYGAQINSNRVVFKDLLGVAYREDDIRLSNAQSGSWNSNMVLNPPRPPIKDLDSLPLPAYHLLSFETYQRYGYIKSDKFRFTGRSSIILTTRGCPFHCSFCTLYIYGHKARFRSVENVLKELHLLVEKYGVRILRFQDLEFVIQKRRTKNLCEAIIKSGINIKWSCQTRYDSVDPDLLALMKEAGCYHINYGFESGSQVVLDANEKKQNIEEMRQTLQATSKLGIHSSNNVLLGLLGETRQTIQQSLNIIKKAYKLPNVTFASASLPIPYPDTLMYKIGVESELFEPINRWSEFSRVLNKCGQIGNDFSSPSEIVREVQHFNLQLRKINWKRTYGSFYAINPRFIARYLPKFMRYILSKQTIKTKLQ